MLEFTGVYVLVLSRLVSVSLMLHFDYGNGFSVFSFILYKGIYIGL